jgi:hypothetical protein
MSFEKDNDKAKRKKCNPWTRFVEELVNVVFAGKNGNCTTRLSGYMTETEEELLGERKKRMERSDAEREQEMAE